MLKTLYFTENNTEFQASAMMDEVSKVIKLKTKPIIFNNAALLVIDMQKYFIDSSSRAFIPSAKAIIPNINKLIALFKHHGRPIVFTKHLNDEQNAGMMGDWWQNILERDSNFSKIILELDSSDCTIIEKTQYDCFYNTNLDDILRETNIQQVFITGVMTHLCCETTARSSFVRGFQPFLIVDGTATYNEDFHKATLLNLSHGFSVPVLTKNVKSSF